MEFSHDASPQVDFSVSDTQENFDYWSARPYLSEDLRRKIAKANVLVAPFENSRGSGEQVFPQAAQQFFAYLLKHTSEGIVPEICIEDADYKEVALHADLITIGCVVVKYALAPIVVGLIVRYLGDRWMKGRDQATVKLELTVVKEDRSASQLRYEGPYASLEATVRDALRVIRDN